MKDRTIEQIKIENLMSEIERLKEELNSIANAKATLKRYGYFTDNLWSTFDVTDRHDCDGDKAQEVLSKALNNDYTMEQIWLAIESACDDLGIKVKVINN
jgi:hypothetical protein